MHEKCDKRLAISLITVFNVAYSWRAGIVISACFERDCVLIISNIVSEVIFPFSFLFLSL